MSWPAYTLIAAASAAGSAVISGLLAAGKTIFWAASWLCTWLDVKEWPHASNPPATSKIAASARPATTMSASNVLLRISMPPCIELADSRIRPRHLWLAGSPGSLRRDLGHGPGVTNGRIGPDVRSQWLLGVSCRAGGAGDDGRAAAAVAQPPARRIARRAAGQAAGGAVHEGPR